MDGYAEVAQLTRANAAVVTQGTDTSTLSAVPGAPADVVVPDWSFDLAKARYRVVTEWRAHTAKHTAKGMSKKESTSAFVSAYNAGLLLPDAVRAQVTEISLPTLYRWDSDLKKHHDDMLALADRRGKWRQGGAKGLGQIGEDAEIAFLQLYLHENCPTMMMAYRSLSTVLESRDIPVPPYTGVRRFFERFDDTLGSLARHFMHRKQVKPARCRFNMMGLTFESDVLHGINKELVAHFSHANLAQVYVFDGDRFLCTARPVESVHPMAELLGSELDVQAVRAQLKTQAKLRADTRKTAEQIGGTGSELLLGLPHMQGAAERRQPLVIVNGRALEAPEPTPVLSDDERAALTAVVERRKALTAARPSYESPVFFSSELERYDFLFNVRFEQCLTLTPDDAAFMARYEASEEYQVTGRRYEQLRRMYAATAQPLEATA